MAAVIDVLGDSEDADDAGPLDDAGREPLFGNEIGTSDSNSGAKGSLLPDDLLVGLDDEISDAVGDQPLTMTGQAEAPVASLSDFDEVEVLSEKDKKKRLARKTAALPKLGGLSRPWVVAFLFLLLVITALAAKVVMQESAQEEEKIRVAKQRAQRADRVKRAQVVHKILKVVTEPPGATGSVGGVAQGLTPYNQTVKGNQSIEIVLSKDGFRNAKYTVDPKTIPANGQPVEIRLVMVKAEKKKVPIKPDAALQPKEDGQFVPAVVREKQSGLRKAAPSVVKPTQSGPKPSPVVRPETQPQKRVEPIKSARSKGSTAVTQPERSAPKRKIKKRRPKKKQDTMANPYD